MIRKEILKLNNNENIDWYNIISINEEDKQELINKEFITKRFLEYAIDVDESARFENDKSRNIQLFCYDIPYFDNFIGSIATTPIVFITKYNDVYTFITDNDDYDELNDLLYKIVHKKVYDSILHLILEVSYEFSFIYHDKIKFIHKERNEIKKSFIKDNKNTDIYKLLNLEQGLTYLTSSLKTNLMALNSIKRKKDDLLNIEIEKLENIIIELEQATEMSDIALTIIDKEKSTYSTVIDNNLNKTMKFLTAFTVVLTIPTLIYGFWGINTPVPFQENPNGYIYVILISLLFSIITVILFWKNKFFK
ncbi:magnesium transporter CorA family protein [Pseudostreptobacillus hongkongensis]|uniref:magnesium transporter CorA family protein n=1 Tax=Pseudostreptobacillus hongkongensis TaxID=1162717 RepID=UPI00082A49EF|nr:magnesium transporter CorA family protein [Pseudostreptobacillus hongkongensis]